MRTSSSPTPATGIGGVVQRAPAAGVFLTMAFTKWIRSVTNGKIRHQRGKTTNQIRTVPMVIIVALSEFCGKSTRHIRTRESGVHLSG